MEENVQWYYLYVFTAKVEMYVSFLGIVTEAN